MCVNRQTLETSACRCVQRDLVRGKTSSTMLVTGEALITYKPRPPRVSEEARLPLANPACEVIQAVGGAELNVSVVAAFQSRTKLRLGVGGFPGDLGITCSSGA